MEIFGICLSKLKILAQGKNLKTSFRQRFRETFGMSRGITFFPKKLQFHGAENPHKMNMTFNVSIVVIFYNFWQSKGGIKICAQKFCLTMPKLFKQTLRTIWVAFIVYCFKKTCVSIHIINENKFSRTRTRGGVLVP